MNPLTVYIPSFNRSKYLNKTLKDLYNVIDSAQLDNIIEVVVSDNHSDDEGYKDIEDLYANRPNFTYIKQQVNIGLSANIMYGFANLKYKYIWVLSDDDDVDYYILNELASNVTGESFDHFYIRSAITGDFRCDEIKSKILTGSQEILSVYSSFSMLGLISSNVYSHQITSQISKGYDSSWTLFPHVSMYLNHLDNNSRSKIIGDKNRRLNWEGSRKDWL